MGLLNDDGSMAMSPVAAKRGLIAAFAVMVTAIIAFVGISTFLMPSYGPSLVNRHGDTIWLVSHGALHLVDGTGAVRYKRPMRDFGLSEIVSDLQALSEREFLTHDSSTFFSCDIAAVSCKALSLEGNFSRRDNRRMQMNATGEWLAVANTSLHELLIYRRANDGLWQLHGRSSQGFRFPNQLRWVGERLFVANTNQHTISRVDDLASVKIATSIAVENPALRPNRRWPFAMDRTQSDEWWVLIANNGMVRADVMRVGGSDDATTADASSIAVLSRDQDPVSLAMLSDGRVLIADSTNFLLQTYDPVARIVSPFGSAAFNRELADAQIYARWMRKLPTALMTLIGVCLLAGLLMARKAGELQKIAGAAWTRTEPPINANATGTQDAAAASVIERSDTTGVAALPGATRVRRVVLFTISLLSVVMLLGLIYIAWPYFYSHDCHRGPCDANGFQRVAMLMPVILLVLLQGWLIVMLRGLENSQIATDGRNLLLKQGSRRRVIPFAAITLSRQCIWYGWRRFPLRLNDEALFDEAQLQRAVIDRLPPDCIDNRSASAAMRTHLWRRAGKRGKLALLLIFFAIVGWFVSVLVTLLLIR